MIQYMQAEHLTSKRTFIRKLIILIPLLNTAFSFLLNAAYFMTGTFNWWAVIFMPLMIALMCGLSVKKEKKSANDRAVYSLPADLKSIWFSKISLIALYSLLSQIVFLVIMFLLGLVFPAIAAVQLKGIEASSLLWLSTLWEIPFCLWIARQFGFTAVILVNMIAAFVLGIVPASGSLWWLSPWSWSVRLMSPILGIHPNGIPLPANSGLLNGNVIIPAIILSILSFIAISFVSAVSFSKGGNRS
ncbi:lantibiotic immunity ABC transporter MutE/EpiE family permease subunit [Bacillus velezensis]|uniref:lantibiotic immunity ABC transporter MutE/EpiE family permease subunit n=1 Tax=Bacillus velezensis TaxID=492670 RepID=UPI003CF3D07D